jgi:pimeloyl-ACP methyl ester carboxylesterase
MPQSAPRPGDGHSRPIPQPAPYSSKFVEVNGLKLHYLDYGTAGRQTVLCVHGGGGHAHWYDFIASGLAADYHVLSIDLRGHGESDWVDPPAYFYTDYASDLAAFVEKLDLRDFVLIGHSMAGAVVLMYSAKYPGRVNKLIVVDSTVNLSPERIAAMRDVGSRPGRSYATLEEFVTNYRLRPGNSLATPEVLRYIARESARQFPDGTWKLKFDRSVYATREVFDGMPLWDDIKIPALLVRADHSGRINPEVVANVKARCPQVEAVEVSASDHHVTLDNPIGFVEAVKPFLAKQR